MFVVQFKQNLEIIPLGNVRLFCIIRKSDGPFLKMSVFREHLMHLCVFRGSLVNSLENLQIPPLGNVRLFRIIRKHGTTTTTPRSENVRLFRRIRRNEHLSPKCCDLRKTKIAILK